MDEHQSDRKHYIQDNLKVHNLAWVPFDIFYSSFQCLYRCKYYSNITAFQVALTHLSKLHSARLDSEGYSGRPLPSDGFRPFAYDSKLTGLSVKNHYFGTFHRGWYVQQGIGQQERRKPKWWPRIEVSYFVNCLFAFKHTVNLLVLTWWGDA